MSHHSPRPVPPGAVVYPGAVAWSRPPRLRWFPSGGCTDRPRLTPGPFCSPYPCQRRKGAHVAENIAADVLAAQRREKAIRLRVRGAHWSEISSACGYPSPAAALADVGRAMAEATRRAEETADAMRDTANLR